MALDYESPHRRRHSSPWLVALWAFPVCWIAALIFYWSNTFESGFEDEVFHWSEALIVVTVFGSAAGAIAYVVAVALVSLSQSRRSDRAG